MPKTKVARKEWLDLGVELFADSGQGGINVELMAKKLKCNKSSFYWHFKNRTNFLLELIEHWLTNSSGSIISITYFNNNPVKTFETFLTKSFKDKSRGDLIFHLRKLAHADSRFQEVVNDIDNKRQEYITLMIKNLGYNDNDARVKAQLFLHFFRGWYQVNKYKESSEPELIDAMSLVRTLIPY